MKLVGEVQPTDSAASALEQAAEIPGRRLGHQIQIGRKVIVAVQHQGAPTDHDEVGPLREERRHEQQVVALETRDGAEIHEPRF